MARAGNAQLVPANAVRNPAWSPELGVAGAGVVFAFAFAFAFACMWEGSVAWPVAGMVGADKGDPTGGGNSCAVRDGDCAVPAPVTTVSGYLNKARADAPVPGPPVLPALPAPCTCEPEATAAAAAAPDKCDVPALPMKLAWDPMAGETDDAVAANALASGEPAGCKYTPEDAR